MSPSICVSDSYRPTKRGIISDVAKAVATDFEVVRPGSGCGLFNVGVVCLM